MPAENYPPLTFTPGLVDQTPEIGRVLAELMDDQVHVLESEIAQKFKKSKIRKGLVMKLLSSFVTEDDTRQPRSREQLSIPGYQPEVIDFCLDQLKASRILKDYGEGTYELVHDTLARHLAHQRDEETATIIEIVRAVKGGFNTNKLDKTHFLGEFALVNLRKYEEPIRQAQRLNKEEWAFVEASEKDMARKIRRRQLTFLGILGVAIVMTIGSISFFTMYKNQEALYLELKQAQDDLDKKDQDNQQLIKTQKVVSEAMQEQRSDRAKAWKLLDFSSSVGDGKLQSQIKTQLIQEYPQSPFNNESNQVPENEKILIDPGKTFYCAIMKGSYQVLFKPLDTLDTRHKILLTPAGNPKYQRVIDIMQPSGTEKILTLHQDGKLFLWDPLHRDTAKLVVTFPVPEGVSPTTLVPFPGGALVGIGPIVYQVFLDGRKFPSRFVIGFDRPVKHLAVNPTGNGDFAVVKENSHMINMCHVNADTIVKVFDNFEFESVTSLAYSPDGKMLFAAFEGDIGILWTFKNPQIHTLFRGHSGFISDVQFSADGNQLLTSGWDQKVILWDITGRKIKELLGHKSRVHYISFLSGDFAVSADEDGRINYWYIGTLADNAEKLPNRIRALACSSTEEKVAYSFYDDTLGFFVWDLTMDSVQRFQQPLKRSDQRGGISALTFSPDGKAVLTGSDNNLTSLVNLEDEKANEDYRSGLRGNMPQTNGITSVDINDKYVVIGNKQASVKADKTGLDTEHFALIRRRKDPANFFVEIPHSSGVNVVKFLHGQDSLVLTGCDDGNVYIWNFLTTPKPLLISTLSGHSSRISSCAVSKKDSSQYIMIGSKDNTASLWVRKSKGHYTNNDILFRDLNGSQNRYAWHASDVTDVSFSEVGPKLEILTASSDGSVKLWEQEGTSSKLLIETPTLIRHSGEIRAARFTFDNKYIITGGDDRMVKAWDVNTLVEKKIESIMKRRPGVGGN